MRYAIGLGWLVLLNAFAAYAAAPAMLPVQGYLSNAGTPLDGSVDLTVKLYSTATGGTALYSETQTVDAAQGYFTLYVGNTTPVDLAIFRDNGQLFLGLQVNADPEMAPRFRIASTPYAGYAEYAGEAALADTALDANALGGVAATGYRRTTVQVPWADVSVPTPISQIAGLSCVNQNILQYSAGAWSCQAPQVMSEADPYFTAAPASGITAGQITNWGAAYGWGNHGAAGYLTSVPANSVDTTKIADGAVASADIADGAVATADLANDAVTSGKILDATIGASDLAGDAVTSGKILDGTVGTLDLAADSVTSGKIADGTISSLDLGVDSITSSKITDGAVTSADILDGTVAASDVAFNFAGSSSKGGAAGDLACSGCVASAEIADGSIAFADLASNGCAANQVVQYGAASFGCVNKANDADQLDSRDGAFYQDAGNLNAGTLNTDRYSAYSDLTAEGALNNDAGGDLLTRDQGDVRWATGRSAVGMDSNTLWPTVSTTTTSYNTRTFTAPANGYVLAQATGGFDFRAGSNCWGNFGDASDGATCAISLWLNDIDDWNFVAEVNDGRNINCVRASFAATRLIAVTAATSYSIYVSCYSWWNGDGIQPVLTKSQLSTVFIPNAL